MSPTPHTLTSPPEVRAPVIVKLWRAVRDPLGFLTEIEARFGDIATLRKGRSYAVFHPDYVKHVLQDNHANYEKGPRYRSALAPLMGNGLFTSEGAFWLRQRRTAQGAFQRAHLPELVAPVRECVTEAADLWDKKGRAGESVALREEVTALTLRSALRMFFGVDAQTHMAALIDAVFGVNEEIKLGRAFLPVHLPHWAPTPGRRRFARSLRTIDEFVYRIIAQRKAAADPGSDLVGRLIRARDPETGEAMDDLQLRDEIVTMLNAGHDTVTDAIVWTVMLLAQHPESQARARAEVRLVAGSDWPNPGTVEQMEFLGRVFREALRLYPPAWGFGRTSIHADTIGGYTIPAGCVVVISPFITHRSPRFWEQPERFEPDRFLPAASAARPKFAYFPFGSGPRMCIGANLAMLEAPLIVASLLQRFEFQLAPGTVLTLSPRISLRPGGRVGVVFRSAT